MLMSGEYSLYFHIPFCTKKCPYCHFFVVKDQEELKRKFVIALKEEWQQKLPSLPSHPPLSIYFGGGTPTLLSPAQFTEIFSYLPSAQEITCEANPETITSSLISHLRSLGVNRISMGVQSFDDPLLKEIGREHDSQKAIEAVWTIYNAGIENISIDIMYDLPHQTLESFKKSIEVAASLPITHLSLYNLLLEPPSLFHRKAKAILPTLPEEEESLAMLECAIQILEREGFERYEISAFCRQKKVSLHNSGYWKGRPFLGYGPSAFSDWDEARFSNVSNLSEYMQRLSKGLSPEGFREKLEASSRIRERVAIALRLMEGIELPSLPEEIRTSLRPLVSEGFLTTSSKRVQLTPKGALFYDSIAEAII